MAIASLVFTGVAQTGPVLNITEQHASIIKFVGDPGVEYQLQSSVNLTDWQFVSIVPPGNGTNYAVTNVTASDKMFYRIEAGTIIQPPGNQGILMMALRPIPGNGTLVYPGQSYDVASYKIMATNTDMAINNVGFDFDARLWLYASAITVKDDSGTIVAQVTNISASDFTEIVVGSDYRIFIPSSQYVVRNGETNGLTVNISFLANSDRASGVIDIIRAEIRSVDEFGVVDTEAVIMKRSFIYQNVVAGSVDVSLDASSPLAGLVQISTAAQTANVPLAVYDVKCEHVPGTFQSASVLVNITGVGNVSTLFANIQLRVSGLTYSAGTIQDLGVSNGVDSAIVTFNNMAVQLPADTYIPVTILGTIAQDTGNTLDGSTVTVILTAHGTTSGIDNDPYVENISYASIAVNPATVIGNTLTFTGANALLSNLSANLGSAIIGVVDDVPTVVGYNVNFGFTITAGDNTVYISSNPTEALSLEVMVGATLNMPPNGIVAVPDMLAGDNNTSSPVGYYVIPAGSSRQFTYNGSLMNSAGMSDLKTAAVTGVRFGDSTMDLMAHSINYGLESLRLAVTF